MVLDCVLLMVLDCVLFMVLDAGGCLIDLVIDMLWSDN